MRFFQHIFSLKNGLAVLLGGCLCLSAFGQDYIVETETGKVSVFVKQVDPDSSVFEITLINISEDTILFNRPTGDMNPIVLRLPDGLEFSGLTIAACFPKEPGPYFSDYLPPKTFRKWQTDIQKVYGLRYPMSFSEEMVFEILCMFHTSVGQLKAQPQKYYHTTTK